MEEFIKKNKITKDKDVAELYLPFQNLVQLRPLNCFKNLNIVWLHSNKVKIPRFINKFNVGFSYLFVVEKIQKLDFLKDCLSISEIYLQNNFIQSIDFCLRELLNLKVLCLQGNQLVNLENVANELSYLKDLRNLSKKKNNTVFDLI